MESNIKIRTLRPEEIELKSQTVRENGAMFALYKDSRVDMNILDEAFGTLGWKNTHEVIDGKTFCTISIWDSDKKEWVTKSNVGSLDANNGAGTSVKVKGEISDSFKRAATVVGIGRELYTAPMIWIGSDKIEIKKSAKGTCFVNTPLRVADIAYDETRRICFLKIAKARDGQIVYSYGQRPQAQAQTTQTQANRQSEQQNAPVQQNTHPVNPAPAQQSQQTQAAVQQGQPSQAPVQQTPASPQGGIQVAPAANIQVKTPGDFVIPVGYAKGQTISYYWQLACTKLAQKNKEIDKNKIFEYYLNLPDPTYTQLKQAVSAFMSTLK